MSNERFKQIRDYFYSIKDKCIRLISACDNANDVNRIFHEYYGELIGGYRVAFMLTDYEHERSKLLSLYNECLGLMRFKCLLYMNILNDDEGGLINDD
jgi:hypothetical protein